MPKRKRPDIHNNDTQSSPRQGELQRGSSSNPNHPGRIGDFTTRRDTFNYAQEVTQAFASKEITTQESTSSQITKIPEHTIEQKILNAIKKKEKGENLTNDDKKYLLWQKKSNGEKLNGNEKESLALFKNKNGIELSEGEEKAVEQRKNSNKKSNEKHDKKVSLALAIENNIKGKELTPKQQDLLQEIPEDERKILTNEHKSLIEQNRNKSKKRYNKLKYLTNIIKGNKYNEVIEAYDNRIIQAKEDGNAEEVGKQQRERESFQKTWNAFLQTKRGKEIKELLQRQQTLNSKLSDTQHDQPTLENIQQYIDNNKSQIEEQITAYFEENRETNDLNDLLNHVFSLYDSSDTNPGLLYPN